VLCSEYPAEYQVTEVWAASVEELRRLEFRAGGGLGPAPRVEIAVDPLGGGDGWIGEFYGHRDGLNVVAHTPDPESLLVVSGGVAYWVPANAPEGFKVLDFQPVMSVHCYAGSDVLILAGYSRLAAIDSGGGVAWQSTQLVSDEFYEVRLTASVVVARGYSAPDDHEVEWTLDQATGSIVNKD
jgi:hypothetical protein